MDLHLEYFAASSLELSRALEMLDFFTMVLESTENGHLAHVRNMLAKEARTARKILSPEDFADRARVFIQFHKLELTEFTEYMHEKISELMQIISQLVGQALDEAYTRYAQAFQLETLARDEVNLEHVFREIPELEERVVYLDGMHFHSGFTAFVVSTCHELVINSYMTEKLNMEQSMAYTDEKKEARSAYVNSDDFSEWCHRTADIHRSNARWTRLFVELALSGPGW